MSIVPAIPDVVSIEEIDDYFNARGAWNGRRFELASTPAKRCLLWRTSLASWMMHAGWAIFGVLAIPAIAAAVVLGATLLASAFPGWFPEWLARMWTVISDKPPAYQVTPEVLAMAIPALLWTTSLLLARTSSRIRVSRDQDSKADRVEFLEPVIAGGLIGCPNALVVYPNGGGKSSDPEPHHMLIDSWGKRQVRGGVLEKVSFLSETGQHIPSLLWLPESSEPPYRTIIIADERGKGAVAESGMVEALLASGYAILAADLRGRGETLGRVMSARRDNNFPFVAHSIAWDHPAAGRRAFDLRRTLDFVEGRKDLAAKSVAIVGIGGDALPALLAAATDTRVGNVACSGFVNSFISQISAAAVNSRAEAIREWNSSAMRFGRIDNGSFIVDLGAVLPSVLRKRLVNASTQATFTNRIVFSWRKG